MVLPAWLRIRLRLPVAVGRAATHVRLNILPDGGIARLRLFGTLTGDGATPGGDSGDGGIIVSNTIYANTDDTLYSLDPKTNAVTMIGVFSGVSDASTDGTAELA